MEPSATNKNNDDRRPSIPTAPQDQALTISSSGPLLARNAGDEQEKRLVLEPASKEVSRVVVIPERWGQEDLLKDWIDGSAFDAFLSPKEAGSARQALVAEARRVRQLPN